MMNLFVLKVDLRITRFGNGEGPKRRKLNLLAYGENVGYTIFESNDQKQLMHLGHPEYTVHRIISEIERDKEKEMFLLLKILI